MIGVILMNASIFGVFSYASDYLNNVSNMSWTVISLVVLVPTKGINLLYCVQKGEEQC